MSLTTSDSPARLSRNRLHDRMLAGRDEDEFVRSDERIGPYLTLMRGRSFEQENIRWGEAVLEILAQRSGPHRPTAPRRTRS